MTFGKDFIWGVATASYQVEGAAYEELLAPLLSGTLFAKKTVKLLTEAAEQMPVCSTSTWRMTFV